MTRVRIRNCQLDMHAERSKEYTVKSVGRRLLPALLAAILTAFLPWNPSPDSEPAVISAVSFETAGAEAVVRLHSEGEIPWFAFDEIEDGGFRLTLLNTRLAEEPRLEEALAPLARYRIFEEGTRVILEAGLTREGLAPSLRNDPDSFDLIVSFEPVSVPALADRPAAAQSVASSATDAVRNPLLLRFIPSQISVAAVEGLASSSRAELEARLAETTRTDSTEEQPAETNDLQRLLASARTNQPEADVDSGPQQDGSRRWKLDRIAIDAGHGGWDQGAFGKAGFLEKDLSLIIALRLGRMIEEKLGVEVVYTRTDDRFIPVAERGTIANEAKAKLFISIHANQASDSRAYGTETYFLGTHRTDSARVVMDRENKVVHLEDDRGIYDRYDNAESVQEALARSAFMKNSQYLADAVQRQFTDVVGRRNRGVKQAGFYVLFGASMPSVLIELGFLSNPSEEKFLSSSEGQSSMASAIFRAVQDFKLEYEKSLKVASE